jgi:hypothetical protein
MTGQVSLAVELYLAELRTAATCTTDKQQLEWNVAYVAMVAAVITDAASVRSLLSNMSKAYWTHSRQEVSKLCCGLDHDYLATLTGIDAHL